MLKFIFTLSVCASLILSGCATAQKSTLLGSGIGLSIGSTVGLLASQGQSPQQRTQGALIGAAAFGIIGGLIGYQSYKDQQKKDQAKQMELNSANLEMFGDAANKGNRPTLRPAQVRVQYVEDQIKDGVFVPGAL